MEFEEFKKICDEKIKEYPQYKKLYQREIVFAKNYFRNGFDLYQLFQERPIAKKGVLPFLLGFTNEVDENIDYSERVQVKPGASGGIDIDSDFAPAGKEKVFEYLKEKYGKENVLHVGTFSRLGLASAIKDVFRVYDFKDVAILNTFTKNLDSELSLEENVEQFKDTHKFLYQFYLDHKEKFDMIPYFMGKIRQTGTHAGGVVVLDKPVWNYIPVERAGKEIVTAFPESAQDPVLDHFGIIKFDILGISILDVIQETINLVGESGEKLFLIEEDGIRKIVPENYLRGKEFEKEN